MNDEKKNITKKNVFLQKKKKKKTNNNKKLNNSMSRLKTFQKYFVYILFGSWL